MNKLTNLRHHLIAAVPELANDPSRLLTFIDSGGIEFHRGTNYNHGYTAQAQLIVTDYGGEIDAIVIPLLYWLSIYEPDLPPDQAVRFEAEILDNDHWDLALNVQLTERVLARVDHAAGRIESRHIMPAYPELDAAAPDTWQLFTQNHRDAAGEYAKLTEWDNRPASDE